MSLNEVHMMWDDAVLTVAPSNTELERFLTYKVKSLEADKKQPWKMVTKIRTEELYKVIDEKHGYRVIQTMQGLWLKIKTFLEEKGYTLKFYDMRLKFPQPKLNLMNGFRFNQQQLLTDFLSADCSGLLGAPTRYGKCLGKNTKVMMYDGSLKYVQDIVNGDLVMGQNSEPRRVIGCASGYDILYKIIPNKGESFIVTKDHQLLLYRTFQGSTLRRSKSKIIERKIISRKSPNLDGKEVLVTPEEYECASKTFKHLHKLVKRPVRFAARSVPVDPYCYGLWLGDGHTKAPALTTMDVECADAWKLEATRLGLSIRKDKKQDGNKASVYHMTQSRKSLKNTNIFRQVTKLSAATGHKRILDCYKINSIETQLQVLAGLIDSDGYVNKGRKDAEGGCYAIVGKYEDLMWDIVFLCRSLGMRANLKSKRRSSQTGYTALYYEVQISGALADIPVRLERKKLYPITRVNPCCTGFKVENVGVGEYFGFELEGPDKLFLLGDFTVTHNTTLIKNTLRAYPNISTVVTVPGRDLVKQLYDELKAALPGREVRLIGAGSTKDAGEDINVCSMDSLHKCDPGLTRLLLVDEPHACVTDSRLPELVKFDKARKIGFGATLKGRFDQKDILIEALLGPVLAERTFTEAVAEGAVCPLIVCFIMLPLRNHIDDRKVAYDQELFKSSRVAKVTSWICHHLIPEDWQTLMFIKNEKQAEYYLDYIGEDGTIAMAKRMTPKERNELMERMKDSSVKRCLASEIYAQGVTFNHVRSLINLSGGGANTSTIQKPGRLAEVRPGKRCGVIFDFFFTPGKGTGCGNFALCRESKARLAAYTEKGYEIVFTESYSDLEAMFKSKVL